LFSQYGGYAATKPYQNNYMQSPQPVYYILPSGASNYQQQYSIPNSQPTVPSQNNYSSLSSDSNSLLTTNSNQNDTAFAFVSDAIKKELK